MSGRIGDLNTAGRGCVFPLGVPSPLAMVTVGRVAIVETGVMDFSLSDLLGTARFNFDVVGSKPLKP